MTDSQAISLAYLGTDQFLPLRRGAPMWGPAGEGEERTFPPIAGGMAFPDDPWPPFIEPIRGFFVTMWHSIEQLFSDWILPLWNWLQVQLQNLLQWLWDRIGAAWNDITTFLRNLGTNLGGIFGSLSRSLSDWFQTTWDNIGTWVSGVWKAALNGLQQLADNLADWFQWIYNQLGIWSTWVKDNFVVWIQTLWNNTTAAFQTTWEQTAAWGKWIGDTIGSTITTVKDDFLDPWVDWLKGFTDQITGAITGIPQALWNNEVAQWTAFFETNRNIYMALSKGYAAWIQPFLQETATNWMNAVETSLEGFSPITPERYHEPLTKLLGAGMMSLATLAGMTVAGDVLHPLKQLGFGRVAAFLHDFIDYKHVGHVWLDTWIKSAIATPMEHFMLSQHRTSLPDVRTLQGLWAGGWLNDQQFEQGVAYNGFPDTWYEPFKAAAFRPATPFLLRTIAQTGKYEHDLFERLLTKAGYNRETKDLLQQVYSGMATEDLKGTAAPNAQNAFKYGYLDEAGLRAHLQKMGWGQTYVDQFLQDCLLSQHIDLALEWIAVYKAQYAKDQIDDDQFRAGLQSLGLMDERVDTIYQLAKATKLPAPYKAPARPGTPLYLLPEGKTQEAAATLAYYNGLIDEAAYRSRLDAIGMPAALRDATVLLEQTKIQAKPKPKPKKVTPYYESYEGKLKLDAIKRLHYAGYITDSDAAAGLQAIQMPDSVLQAELSDLQAKVRTKPVVKPPKIKLPYQTDAGSARITLLRAEFRRKEIDTNSLYSGLVALQMPTDMAGSIVDYEELILSVPPAPAPVPPQPYYLGTEGQVKVRTLLIAGQSRQIDLDQYMSALQKLGMSADLSNAYKDQLMVWLTAHPPKPETAPKDPYETATGKAQITYLREAFARKTISAADLLSGLKSLQMPDAEASAIVAYEQLIQTVPAPSAPQPSQLPYETDTGKVQLHTLRVAAEARLIDLDEYGAGLRALQVPDTLSAAMLADLNTWLQAHPEPAPKDPVPTYKTEVGKIQVKSLKKQFELELVDDDTLYADLLKLEMSDDLANAVVDYEDLVMTAKGLTAAGLS